MTCSPFIFRKLCVLARLAARICERRLCETVDIETVATTLTLAEQNHAEELKKVRMVGEGFRCCGAVMSTLS